MRLYLSRPEQYAVAVLLLAILGALVVLSYAYATRQKPGPPPPFLQKVNSPAASAAPAGRELQVHVAGAVRTPGLYKLPGGARVADALSAAGGATDAAAVDALNLAAEVQDGWKITVPTKEEWERARKEAAPPPVIEGGKLGAGSGAGTPTPATGITAPVTGAGTGAPGRTAGAPPAGARGISLNTATKAELESIKGIGPVLAQNIIDYRAQHGKFTDLAQLLNVPRIGPKTYEKIVPYLTL